jgi:hypothetical protein
LQLKVVNCVILKQTILVLESDVQQLSSPDWFRCGRLAGEISMLTLDPSKELPFFAANQMRTAHEPLYTQKEIALVRHGVRAATECVTQGSPFFRNDIFL